MIFEDMREAVPYQNGQKANLYDLTDAQELCDPAMISSSQLTTTSHPPDWTYFSLILDHDAHDCSLRPDSATPLFWNEGRAIPQLDCNMTAPSQLVPQRAKRGEPHSNGGAPLEFNVLRSGLPPTRAMKCVAGLHMTATV